MAISFWRYWLGRWRLRWGFCPWCDSSPPDQDCIVCEGTYDYGPPSDDVWAQWRRRWEALR